MSTPTGSRLRVSVLGPVRAWQGDCEIELGQPRQRILFALLAANPGRLVGRTELIEGIWGVSPPATAAGSVYTYISGLRRGLGPCGRDVIASRASGYALLLEPADLDRERFMALVSEAAGLRTGGDPAGTVAKLEEALSLWRGEAYAGLSSGRLTLERAHLQGLRLAAVEQRARALTELGDDGLVAELTGLIHDHPLHEPLHELLMLALHRAGRSAEALEVFGTARRTLATELGVEPGPDLRELRRKIMKGSAGSSTHRRLAPQKTVSVQVTRIPREDGTRIRAAGRDAEVHQLRALVEELAAGRGGAVWVQGQPGIGKTDLLVTALAEATDVGCQVAWTAADELDRHVPLRVIGRALGLPHDLVDLDSEPVATARIVAHVRASCASAPLLLVVDGLQWVDGATLRLWNRLVVASRRLPLLVVAATRTHARTTALTELRHSVEARQGHVLTLNPLPADVVEELFARRFGAPLGPRLAAAARCTLGNPLFAEQMTTALLLRGAIVIIDGHAEIDEAMQTEIPQTIAEAVDMVLATLSSGTRDVLQQVALFGTEFTTNDVVAVTGRSPFDLIGNLEEAMAAGVLVDTGTDLAFRYQQQRQSMYESIPATLRAIRRREAAEALHLGGCSVLRVAEQLTAETVCVDDWVLRWTVRHVPELLKRAPQLGSRLIRWTLSTGSPDTAQREVLLIALVRADVRLGGQLTEASEALALATRPDVREEMRHALATATVRQGDTGVALRLLDAAIRDPQTPEPWHARHRSLAARTRRGDVTDLDETDRQATKLLAEAIAGNEPFEAAYALQTTWLTHTIRRDHESALVAVDRAIGVARQLPDLAAMYLDLLDDRIVTLQNLDRLHDAEQTLRDAGLFAIRHGLTVRPRTASAMQCFWFGRWDDALAEITATGACDDSSVGTLEPGRTTVELHGVAALLAGHRADTDLAEEFLAGADAQSDCGYLLAARAVVAEQRNGAGEALEILRPLLAPDHSRLLPAHRWLPDAIRLAIEHDDNDFAERAAAICAQDAADEARPAGAHTAAARCRALMTGDPEPALAAAVHYKRVGRVFERAAALEDAAVLLAARRLPHDAARTGGDAVQIYSGLGALWDLTRTHHRLADYGITLESQQHRDEVTPVAPTFHQPAMSTTNGDNGIVSSRAPG